VSPADSDQDGLTLLIVQAPAKGTVQFNGNLVVYTANAGSSGNDSFAVQAFDQLEYSSPMVVMVDIQPATTPPPPPDPPPSTPASGGGGSMDIAMLLALLLLFGVSWRCELPRNRLN
jgi:hypothetical protein